MPNPVGVHAGGEWIGGVGDMTGECESTGTADRRRIGADQRGEKTTRHFGAGILVAAANENLRVATGALKHHGNHRGTSDGVGLAIVFLCQFQCLVFQRHVSHFRQRPGGRASFGGEPHLLHRTVGIRPGAASGGISVGEVGNLHVTLVALPHGEVESLPVRRLVFDAPREAAVDGVSDDFEVVDDDIDAHVRPEHEQVQVILGEREGL